MQNTQKLTLNVPVRAFQGKWMATSQSRTKISSLMTVGRKVKLNFSSNQWFSHLHQKPIKPRSSLFAHNCTDCSVRWHSLRWATTEFTGSRERMRCFLVFVTTNDGSLNKCQISNISIHICLCFPKPLKNIFKCFSVGNKYKKKIFFHFFYRQQSHFNQLLFLLSQRCAVCKLI